MEISRRHLLLREQEELHEKMQLLIDQGVERGDAIQVGTQMHAEIEEQRRLAHALEGSTRNQRRVAMKRAKKAARKAK